MKNKLNIFLAMIPFLCSIILMPLYIYTFNRALNFFWVVFIMERLISVFYNDQKLDTLFDTIFKSDSPSKKAGKFYILSLLLFTLIGIGVLIYILFTTPKLFIIIIIGEIIDRIITKIIKLNTSKVIDNN